MDTPAMLPPGPEAAREIVEHALDYRFRSPDLLDDALRILFPPLTPEAAGKRQRLEFLGDAGWDCAVAWAACDLWQEASAGELTRLRSTWTSAEGLARLARLLGLPEPDNPSLNGPSERTLAEMVEAIFGAMMLDGGFEGIRKLASRIIVADGLPQRPPPLDPKSALQMLAQTSRVRLPTYRLLERRGPPHQPMFQVEGIYYAASGEIRAVADRPNRQAAEQEVARLILAQLDLSSDTTQAD